MDKKQKQVVKEFRDKGQLDVKNLNELEDALSEKFEKLYDDLNDAQYAFDVLDDEMNGLLSKYFVYTLSKPGSSWSVDISENYKESNFSAYQKRFESIYDEKFPTLEDMISKLENRVIKDNE